METRPYGVTGESVTVIGLGGACLNQRSQKDGVDTVRRALDLGITYFDTSPAYGRGTSQIILGEALADRPEGYMLATKVGYLATPEMFRSRDALRAQLGENLRALRRNQVDVLQVHLAEWECWWKDGSPVGELLKLEEGYDFADAPVMQMLRQAKAEGLCRFIGITADHADELAHVLRHVDVDSCLVAYDYTVLSRRAHRAALPLAREKNVAYVAAGIIKTVLTALRPEWTSAAPPSVTPEMRRSVARLYELQKASGLSAIALSVRYLLGDPAVTTILVGSATPAELEECVAAAEASRLPPELHKAIDELEFPS